MAWPRTSRLGHSRTGRVSRSRWSPPTWDGFDRTELPVTARADGRAEIAFGLDALPTQPLHREWAISVVARPPADTPEAQKNVLRAQLVKFGMEPSPPQTPEQFAAVIQAEQPRWAKAIRDSGAKVD